MQCRKESIEINIQRRYLSIACVVFILVLFLSACKSNPLYEKSGFINATTTNDPIIEKTQIQPNLDVNDHLLQALSAVPEGSSYILFINWENIKTQLGFSNINSSSDWELRKDFFLSVFDHYPVDSAYGIMRIQGHAEQWGWDPSDLEWEVLLENDQPPGYILKFRDGFDFATVVQHFEERGFKISDYSGIPTYTHKIDTSQDWLRTTELAIFNTAILQDDKIIILSPNYKTIIDTYQNRVQSVDDVLSIQTASDQFGNLDVGFISADPCAVLSSEAILERANILPFDTKQIEAQLKNRPTLHDYENLVIGYTYENNKQMGVIVMQFAEASLANEDIVARQKLATEGFIQSSPPQTYTDTYFSLLDSFVTGQDIVFKIQPIGKTPSLFFHMVNRRDMTFATCQ